MKPMQQNLIGNIEHLIGEVCQTITPNWPLDQMIAVSPYWHRIEHNFEQVSKQLEQHAGSRMSMDADYYLNGWQQGEIARSALEQAATDLESGYTVEQLVELLSYPTLPLTPPPLLCDALDGQRDLSHQPAWCDTITHQISQFCAAYFDENQSDWHAQREKGLFTTWREAIERDYSVTLLMKSQPINQRAKQLPYDAELAVQSVVTKLMPEESAQRDYLQACLLRINGWASWCAYLNWQANFQGQRTNHLSDLLAIRLCWEWLIDDQQRGINTIWHQWQQQWHQHYKQQAKTNVLHVWQRAHELSYQHQLLSMLRQQKPAPVARSAVKVQAVFCIDVRSEVIRRHLEDQSSSIETLGFAGFFGLPASYTPLGTEVERPQLPGLLAPSLIVTDSCGDAKKDVQLEKRRKSTLSKQLSWQPFTKQPGASFTLVESMGLGYLAKLVKRTLPSQLKPISVEQLAMPKQSGVKPRVGREVSLQQKAQLAADILIGMGLGERQARLVLLVGHGSQTDNNPQKAGLDCGACCGQSGEVNARVVAGLLNEPEVREKLHDYGVTLNPETLFIAGLHNTTTEALELYDVSTVAKSHQDDVTHVLKQMRSASCQARRERSAAIDLDEAKLSDNQLERVFKRRANDWSQTRPEWGLVNNAAFIIAPRQRSKHTDLQGRVFMHEYHPEQDNQGSLLEKIMTAPMLVTHWINMQYFASTVDNFRYGSGNKTLHNVVGGRIGLFEGNGGDLRGGLAMQSIHDGNQWRHQPLRLTVVIDAPQARIESIIAQHAVVKNLIDNQWLYLVRFTDDGFERYQHRQWTTWRE